MNVSVHKDLEVNIYKNVIQISVVCSEEVKELEMPQETIIHIIQNENGNKTKTSILCDTNVILTAIDEELLNENTTS